MDCFYTRVLRETTTKTHSFMWWNQIWPTEAVWWNLQPTLRLKQHRIYLSALKTYFHSRSVPRRISVKLFLALLGCGNVFLAHRGLLGSRGHHKLGSLFCYFNFPCFTWHSVNPSLSPCRVSMDDDLLLPYAHGHGPSHSHRHVRDCQSVLYGNTTHESRPSSNHSGLPVAESTVFVEPVVPGGSRWVYGQWASHTKSVFEPGCDLCLINLRFIDHLFIYLLPDLWSVHTSWPETVFTKSIICQLL